MTIKTQLNNLILSFLFMYSSSALSTDVFPNKANINTHRLAALLFARSRFWYRVGLHTSSFFWELVLRPKVLVLRFTVLV